MVQDVQNQIHLEYTQKCRKILIGSMQVCLISIHVQSTAILRHLMKQMLFLVKQVLCKFLSMRMNFVYRHVDRVYFHSSIGADCMTHVQILMEIRESGAVKLKILMTT